MISKTGVYGIRAMLALAALPDDAWAGVPRIAEQVHVPASYLSKLLQILARAGLVQSQRGATGGFRLARDADSITLYDVVESLEPIERWSECLLGNAVCSSETACSMHRRWQAVQQAYLGMLRASTLADLTHPEQCEAEALGFCGTEAKTFF